MTPAEIKTRWTELVHCVCGTILSNPTVCVKVGVIDGVCESGPNGSKVSVRADRMVPWCL